MESLGKRIVNKFQSLWRKLFVLNIPPWISYPISLGAVALCYYIDRSISNLDATLNATTLESIAIAMSLFFGVGPGMIAAISAGILIDHLDRAPVGFILSTPKDVLFLLLYIAPSLVIGFLTASLRASFQSVNKSELIAKSAVKDREEMLSIVSHDLRTPVTAIHLSAQLLARLEKPSAHASKYINSIMTAAQNMNGLIQGMLDASKIKSGIFTVEKKENDWISVATQVLQTIEPIALQKHILINFEKSSSSIPGFFDVERMSQVLSNLLANALTFTPEGGKITLSIQKSETGIKVEVKDTGIGIAKEKLNSIFERNWQGREHSTQGAGLGLYIARAIVRAHDSDIIVESKLDAGTTFKFLIKD